MPIFRIHRHPDEPRDRFFVVRNILNTIFILLAVAGCAAYWLCDETTGIIIVMVAMAFKTIECTLRFLKK